MTSVFLGTKTYDILVDPGRIDFSGLNPVLVYQDEESGAKIVMEIPATLRSSLPRAHPMRVRVAGQVVLDIAISDEISLLATEHVSVSSVDCLEPVKPFRMNPSVLPA